MFCPVCGSFVHATDILESNLDEWAHYNKVKGTCPCCGNSFKWMEIYTFERCEDIELIEEDEHL